MQVMSEAIRVASICMNSSPDSRANITKAKKLIFEAAKKQADWILLPEMFSYLGPYKNLVSQSINEASPTIKEFCEIAKQLNVILFLGTVPETSDPVNPKVFNTLFVICRRGNIICKYRKTHLFELNDENTQSNYCEAKGYIPGNKPMTLNVDGFNVHLSICFDIRFSQIFNFLQKQCLADVIVCPSAFTKSNVPKL